MPAAATVSRDASGAAVVFFAAAGLVLYVYVGYPMLAWARARIRPRRRVVEPIEPAVSIVLVAHNEADTIEGRIDNLLALDYPRDRVEILIGSDGSTDGTVSRASRYATEGVAVHEWRERRGKPAVLNNLLALATGEIVVFADARQRFERQALRALTSRFADPQVGAVSGELVLRRSGEERSAVGRGEGFYWRYEKLIRSSESLSGSTLCATGAIYAIRRRLFKPIPPDTILDDMLIPARIVREGFAVVFVPEAKAFDDVATTARQEHVRKVRTSAGNFQLLAREPWLLDPRRNPLWLATISHKALRLTLPVLHAALFVTNLALMETAIFQMAMFAQLSFYTAAIAGHALRDAPSRPLVMSVPYAMCLMLGATIVGFVRFVTHTQRVTWQRAIAGAKSPSLRTAAYAGPDRRVSRRG